MSRTFKKVDYDRALDLTVRLGDCLPPELFSPTTVIHSGARASALNDMHAGLAVAMVAVLFSPTSC